VASGTTAGLTGARVALYARYSSDRQSESSIEDQIARCRRFVEERAGAIDPRLVFTDAAISGSVIVRPGWDALMSAVRGKLVDAIVVEDVSRVSRDLGDSATIMRELRYLRVQLLGVGDGVDTSARGSKLLVGVRALLADAYLDDLRDKTQRGLDQRARRGLSTGGLPFGYRSREVEGGHAIEVDTDAAAIVVRVFEAYASGRSRADIAATLNREGISPPRSSRRLRAPSWQETTIRAILGNERYSGVWTYGERRWERDPHTRRRTPRRRDPREVVRLDRPDLRIVPEPLWEAVRGRAEPEQRAKLARERQGSGRRSYLLSGLLRCATCSGLMQIHGGEEGRRYYRCSAARARGTCENRLSVREETIRSALLTAIRDRLASPEASRNVLAICRRVIDAHARRVGGAAEGHRKRAERAETKARRLVEALADGHASGTVLAMVGELEAEAQRERLAAAASESASRLAIALPSPAELAARVLDVARVIDGADIGTARDRLRALLRDGAITMEPRGRTYVARSALLPMMLLGTRTPAAAGPGGRGVVSIAGACSTDDATEIPLDLEVAAA
jgi:site-specific DNA recombinase